MQKPFEEAAFSLRVGEIRARRASIPFLYEDAPLIVQHAVYSVESVPVV